MSAFCYAIIYYLNNWVSVKIVLINFKSEIFRLYIFNNMTIMSALGIFSISSCFHNESKFCVVSEIPQDQLIPPWLHFELFLLPAKQAWALRTGHWRNRGRHICVFFLFPSMSTAVVLTVCFRNATQVVSSDTRYTNPFFLLSRTKVEDFSVKVITLKYTSFKNLYLKSARRHKYCKGHSSFCHSEIAQHIVPHGNSVILTGRMDRQRQTEFTKPKYLKYPFNIRLLNNDSS